MQLKEPFTSKIFHSRAFRIVSPYNESAAKHLRCLPAQSLLDGLPNEILIKIVEFLTLPQDCYSMALVNRHFNQLTVPFLYSTFYSTRHSQWRIWRLLRTIRKAPDLALKLNTISIVGPVIHPAPEDITGSILALFWHRLARKLVKAGFLEYKEPDYEIHAKVILRLLDQCPNLESLCVSGAHHESVPNFRLPGYMVPLVQPRGGGMKPPQCFNHLTNLQFNVPAISWEFLHPVYDLPRLQNLIITGSMKYKNYPAILRSEHSPVAHPRSLTIRHLAITQPSLGAGTLGRFIRNCNSLESFQFTGKTYWRTSDWLGQVFVYLYVHHQTLHSISFVDEVARTDPLPSSPSTLWMTMFVALKALTLPLYTFRHEDYIAWRRDLPPRLQLRKLTLYGTCNRDCLDLFMLGQALRGKLHPDAEITLRYNASKWLESSHIRRYYEYFKCWGMKLRFYIRPGDPHSSK
jgi:hypothetical protein